MSETLLASQAPGTARTAPLVVRFAGDSGDGIQLAGFEFAKSSAEANSDFYDVSGFSG